MIAKTAVARILVGLAGLAATCVVGVAPAAAAGPLVSGGSLSPAFDSSVFDYTVRCDTPVVMHVDAPAGTDVSVDGKPFQSGTVDVPVPLGEDESFTFVVRTDGQSTGYHARCLPPDFPSYAVERPGNPQAQWYIVVPNKAPPSSFVALFDNHGVPVWWERSTDGRPIDAKLLPNGHLAWFTPFGSTVWVERNFDTTDVLHTWTTVGPPPDQHDFQMLPNGDALLMSYPQRACIDISQFKPGVTCGQVIDAEIQEIAPDGHRVWAWNTKDHIGLDETDPSWWPQLTSPYDIVHMNSVEDDGDGIIFSARHLDAIYRIKKSDGSVDWKLGGTTTSKSLTVLNDPLGTHPLSGNHDARRLSDGTVTVHDNGTSQSRPPRAVRYKIDPVAKTATLVESVSDPQVTSAFCCGSARKLTPNGDWVMSWGGTSVVEEMTPASQRVFAITFGDNLFSYRAVPILPGRVSARTLRAGMDRLHPRPPVAVKVGLTGPVNAGAPFTVTARLVDAAGNLVTGYDGPGTWSDISGQLSPGAPAAFVNGVSTTSATVPVAFRNDRITVNADGVTGQSGAFAVRGSLSRIAVSVATPVFAGTPFTVKARAYDSAGNLLTAYNRAATWSDLSGELSPSAPSSFVNGVSTTSATVASPFSGDRITVFSSGKQGQGASFDVKPAT